MIKRLFISLKENGILWTAYYLMRRYFPCWNKFFEKRMVGIEKKRFIPGLNSLTQNKEVWENYDWNQFGEEWNPSEKWKEEFIEKIIYKNIKSNSIILEVGPGAGRWTDYLIKLSNKLILVEVSNKCLDICKKKYKDYDNVEYNLLEDINLRFINDRIVDFVFSYDVFVHIDKRETEKYFAEFNRVLMEDGLLIFHYSKVGDIYGNFFSRFDEHDFLELISNYGFNIVKEYDVDTLNLIVNNMKGKTVNQAISLLKKTDHKV